MTTEAATTLERDFARCALRLGDDALVLAQRLCAWITRAPTVEEDMALSSIALDLVGHARALLALSGRLDGTGRTEDELAQERDGRDFRNTLLTELPCGDFAVTIARQLAFSHYARLHYADLAGCAQPDLAALAGRAAREVDYHRLHADGWTVRLGLGTAESRRRMQDGLDLVWPYTAELFQADEAVARLDVAGAGPAPARVRTRWCQATAEVVSRAGLRLPEPGWWAEGGREGRHSGDFGALLAEMQSTYRQYPGGTW
jgi:ring-1,2-phenylacetyl-CoA epoxidase subunit PaaC